MDFIPTRNAVLVPYLTSMASIIADTPATYNITEPEAAAFALQVETLNQGYDQITDPGQRTSVAIAKFNSDKATAIATARLFNNKAQLSGASNAQLTAAGFPVRDTTRSPQTPIEASVEMILVSAIPEQLRIVTRNPDTPTTKAKPSNCGAVQLAIAIGEVAAVDPSQATETRFYTRSPLTLATTTEQRGKVLTAFARYESRGTIGGVKVYVPWSLPIVVNLP